MVGTRQGVSIMPRELKTESFDDLKYIIEDNISTAKNDLISYNKAGLALLLIRSRYGIEKMECVINELKLGDVLDGGLLQVLRRRN